MPENSNQNINRSTSSQTKGKTKEEINVVENLDLIIKSMEQLSINFQGKSQSKKGLWQEMQNINLYKDKTEKGRLEWAKNFTGLDKFLADGLVEKAGSWQYSNSSWTPSKAAGYIPIVSAFSAYDVVERVKWAHMVVEKGLMLRK